MEGTFTLNYHGESLVIDRRDLAWVIKNLQTEYRVALLARREEIKKQALQSMIDINNAINDTYDIIGANS